MKRTHYDNLQVARTASPEVIKAAYRSLSIKYHPDRNPGDELSARIMTVINEAYAVLSDPERRKRHDEWIDAAKAPQLAPARRNDPPAERPQPPPMNSQWVARSSRRSNDDIIGLDATAKVWVVGALMTVVAIIAYALQSIESGPPAEQTAAQWEFSE